MGAARNSKLATAGEYLMRRRKVRQWTQAEASQQIHKATGVKIPPQELSRIELGQTVAPNMESLSAMGAVYGMEPNEIAELYGYWKPPVHPDNPLPERAVEILRDLERLRPGAQDQLLETFELMIQVAMQREQRQAAQQREQGQGLRGGAVWGPVPEHLRDQLEPSS